MTALTYTSKGAIISACETYRYRLWREWPRKLGEKGQPGTCVFVMLNPSTADGERDDPTIQRCVGFAQRFGYGRLEVVNLFAYRATSPKALLALNHDDDPVGWENQQHIEKTVSSARAIICAWGAHGSHLGQDETTLGWITHWGVPIFALGLTKDGHPRHPLYLPSTSIRIPFPRAIEAVR